MRVSIIIPSYKNYVLTSNCLTSISKFDNGKYDCEIIVVDDYSGAETTDKLRQIEGIILIENEVNSGFSKVCNIGARRAKGDLLVFLNNDTEVFNGWLEAIVQAFAYENNVGAVGVKLLMPNGKIQHAGVVISKDKIPIHIYYNRNHNLPCVNYRREFMAVTAACIAIPKKVFSEVDGFDENYINGFDDIDLCHRIREKGYRILYEPKAVVTHYESVSEGRFNHCNNNMDLYMSRWKNVESDEHKKYREDGFGWLWITLQDLKRTPLYISIYRLSYSLYQRIKNVWLPFVSPESEKY